MTHITIPGQPLTIHVGKDTSVKVEADIARGLPSFPIVALPDTAAQQGDGVSAFDGIVTMRCHVPTC